MLIEDICLKLYMWPYLSYLANIKGFCPPLYRPGFFPIITLSPGATIGTTISTFQPTPPTNQPTPPGTFPTFPTLPTLPSTFIPPPVTNPTQPPPTAPPTPTPTLPSTFSPTPPTNQPPPVTIPTPSPTATTCPPSPLICMPGGQSPLPNCPCIDPRNTQKRQVGPIGSDMIVFSPLGNRRKRRLA